MRRIGRALDDRPAQEEFLRSESGDDVSDRQPELLNRERARVAHTDERAAAADELLEALQIRSGELIAVLRPNLPSFTSAAAAASTRLRAGHRHACVVGDDQHVDLLAERRGEVLWMNEQETEAVLFEHPARPPLVHRAAPA